MTTPCSCGPLSSFYPERAVSEGGVGGQSKGDRRAAFLPVLPVKTLGPDFLCLGAAESLPGRGMVCILKSWSNRERLGHLGSAGMEMGPVGHGESLEALRRATPLQRLSQEG